MDNIQKTPEAPTLPPTVDVCRRDYIYFAITFALTLITANGVCAGGFALGFAAGLFALLVCVICYLGRSFKVNALSVISLVASAVIIASFGIHESTAFAFFKFCFLILSLATFFVSAYGIKAPSLSDFRALFSPFYLFFGASIPACGITARSLASKNVSMGKKIAKILLALLIAVPLLATLTVLLIFSDYAFEGFIDAIDINVGEIILTVFLTALLLVLIYPLVFAIRKDKVQLKASERKPFLSVLDGIFVNTVLASVSLLYILFIISQLSYLGGGFAGLLPSDYTYSEYARRGFFEMCLICIINLGIIFIADVFVKRKSDGLPIASKVFDTFISGFSLFLIASALAKMVMYIRSYGLTFLRLGTSIFMLLLFFAFGGIILSRFIKGFHATPVVLAAACIIMTLTSALEPYNIITSYNVYAYESGMHDEFELDTYYLAHECMPYGAEALISLSEDSNAFVAARAKEQLSNIHNSYYYTSNDVGLRGQSLSRHLASKALAEYYAEK